MSKEDERSAALARRAQQGDYDDGAKLRVPVFVIGKLTRSSCRLDS